MLSDYNEKVYRHLSLENKISKCKDWIESLGSQTGSDEWYLSTPSDIIGRYHHCNSIIASEYFIPYQGICIILSIIVAWVVVKLWWYHWKKYEERNPGGYYFTKCKSDRSATSAMVFIISYIISWLYIKIIFIPLWINLT